MRTAPLLPALALAAVAAVTRAPAPALAAGTDEPSIPHTKFELANGMKVLLIEDHSTPQIALVVWYRVGSKDEQQGRTGFAHLFEHMMFKGSAHVPDGKIDQLFEEAGGWTNAYTWFDQTVYMEMASSSFLERALWLEADRLAGLTETLDQGKLDNQRDVVRNERRQSVDNAPYGIADILIQENLWPASHGYHWDTIGSHEDLVAATVDDVRAFFENYYVPNNATLVVAGDIDPKATRALVEKYLGWIPRGEVKRPRYETPAPLGKPQVVTAKDDVQVPRVYLVWRSEKSYGPDEAALDVAAQVLGSGKSSRLYKRLVFEDRLAQDVSVHNMAFQLGGQFRITVTAKPGVDAGKLAAIVDEELARLVKTGPTVEELERAKNQREAGFLSSLEDLLGRAQRIAEYDVYVGDSDYLKKDLARYRAVTGKEVSRVMKKYLGRNSRVELTVSPEVR
jgi:zinc protease